MSDGIFENRLNLNWTLGGPSALLSRCFLGIVSLLFSEIWHGTRNSCEVVRDRAGFTGKKFFTPKLGNRP